MKKILIDKGLMVKVNIYKEVSVLSKYKKWK